MEFVGPNVLCCHIKHQSFFISLSYFFTFAPPFFPPIAGIVFLSSFFLHFFTSIAYSFFLSLLFSSLHTSAFVGFSVLFMGLFAFVLVGFV